MSYVGPREVSDMARLIQVLNSGVNFDAPESETVVENHSPNVSTVLADQGSIMSGDPSVAAMKSILVAFKQMGGTERLNERAKSDRTLREAIQTVPTTEGTRIGSWEIRVNSDANGLKNYDVTNVVTNEPIAMGLSLYDAAHGLVQIFNEGLGINNSRARQIIDAESTYARSRENAAIFRENMNRAKDETRRAIMEDRFTEALARAKQARIAVSKLVD